MELTDLRPIFSGIVGGLIALSLSRALARWIPEDCNGKSAELLVAKFRYAIWIANALFYSGVVAVVGLVWANLMRNDDWRVLALGIGGGSVAALISLGVFGFLKRTPLKEPFVAYAISNETPVILLYGLLIIFGTAFFAAASSILM